MGVDEIHSSARITCVMRNTTCCRTAQRVPYCCRDIEFIESEIIRYLSAPGQAISYKLGERAWLAGRDAARKARGDSFRLKDWHMAALSLGSLGLDDLADELAQL